MQYFRQLVGDSHNGQEDRLTDNWDALLCLRTRIEKTLSRVSGFRDVSVSFASKEAIIEYSPDEMDLREIGKITEDVRGARFQQLAKKASDLIAASPAFNQRCSED